MTTISKDKQYRTRDGREVRIYSTDGSPVWPVHGAYRNIAGEWQVEAWTANGTVLLDRTNNGDLIEVKPRFRIERWVNVYSDCTHYYSTRVQAIAHRMPCCLATKRIIIEGTEGEDDEEGK